MADKKTPFYMTTAIAYTSGKPHIGNTYEIILADAIARFRRREGYDVYFQTGSDEHGQKIESRAIEAGTTPKQFVDDTAAEIKRLWDMCDTTYDRFIRTTDEDHVKSVQSIFRRLYDKGDIYKGSYKGIYCQECEAFYTESQLVDGKCPICGSEVRPMEEEAYFFRMSKYAPKLIEHINTHPEFIQPVQRKNEMLNNFLLPGLTDLCVSRSSFKWGIPVDFDDKHVVYVWLDALSNYITGLGYIADGECGDLYKKYWPADLHLIGKDIVRFHTIYWPIFLMALDVPLPKQVFGHPWLLQGGEKMSKSKGNVIYADDMIDLFGVDAVRYFCLHEMPYDNDGVITWELMVERYNSDLANTLGNLVSRTAAMTNKYLGGVVADKGVTDEMDAHLKQTITSVCPVVVEKMKELRVADALTEIFSIFKRCNKYVDETEPWVLGKDPEKKDRLSTVLYNLTEGIMIGASLLEAFMPSTAKKIAATFNAPLRELDDLTTWGLLANDTKIAEKPEMLFARKDVKEILKLTAEITAKQKEDFEKQTLIAYENLKKAGKLTAASFAGDKKAGEIQVPGQEKKEEAPADTGEEEAADGVDVEAKPEITYDDFSKLQFRIGEIISCERLPKSKKLLKSIVQIGSEKRQILSGIQKWYSPEEMVGKKVMVITNLKPAKLAGELSEGMILAAEDDEENLALLVPDRDVKHGSEIS